MSFSTDVKQELQEQVSGSRHCRLAELAAIVCFLGDIVPEESEGKYSLVLHTENDMVVRKCFTLWKKTFNINSKFATDEVLNAIKYDKNACVVSSLLLKNACCKRAYLRGIFMCIGSISDPQKSYHLELVCEMEEQAVQIKEIMSSFEIEAKILQRTGHYVVYLKEGAAIVDFLNVVEAHKSLMEFENMRIVKEMRNSINRRVNCEAANITKTVNAATRQVEDILFLQKNYGLSRLPSNLCEMAQVRLEHPDATLLELGQFLDPPVGKSGVNHRLRKICDIADGIRSQGGEL